MKNVRTAKSFLRKIGVSAILVTFVVASFPLISLAQMAPSLDLSVTGSNGTSALNGGSITIGASDSYTYTWSTANIVPGSCQVIAPANSGITDSGSDTIVSGNPYFPAAVGSPVTIQITCTGSDASTLTQSVSINLAAPVVSSVDLKANGSDGPVTLALTDTTYTYTWTSSNILPGSCQITSPANSGVTDSGTDTVAVGNPYFPVAGGSVTITIVCTGISSPSVTDSVTINLPTTGPTPPGPTVPTVTLVANPTSVAPNATSTLTWTSANTVSCSAPWTSATSTAGSQIVTVATTTLYTINCTDNTTTVAAQATVTVVPPAPPGGSCPVPTISSTLAVSGTVGQAFTYTLTSNGTTTAVFTVASSSLPVGLSFATSTNTISGTPTTSGVFTVAVTSTDLCGTDAQNLVITIAAVAPPGGGGGGGGGGSSGGGGGGFSSGGRSTPPLANPLACLYLHDYMRIDFQNDPNQVTLLQIFLKDMEGYDYVNVNGVFDQATLQGVNAFQVKYASDILTPWGIDANAPTGYVYILTLKKINEIYCQNLYPLTISQQNEIDAYRALIQSLHDQGITPLFPGDIIGSTTPGTILPIVGEVSPPKGQNISNLAASILAGPPNLLAALQCFYQLLLILVIIYILGDIMKDVLYTDVLENVLKRFMTKWITIVAGIVIAILIAIAFKDWCIILPLIIALVLSFVWTGLYPKHSSIRAHVKSWYIVIAARTKSLWNKFFPPVTKA